jgi:hypothetical protein
VLPVTLGLGVAGAASDKLAELQKYVWKKGGEEDWIDLQVYLGRLRVALRSAAFRSGS